MGCTSSRAIAQGVIGSKERKERSFEDKYALTEKLLGRGSFSVVQQGSCESCKKQEVAVKILLKEGRGVFSNISEDVDVFSEKNRIEDILQEISIMRRLRHPNIIPLHDYYEESDRFLLVMDLAPGGDLYEQVKTRPYSEEEAQSLFRNLVAAIKYLHSLNIVHRDLKPENILMKSTDSRTEVYLADFGFATESSSDDELDECVGTPQYAGNG